jgi:hypothetical protein
MTGTQIRLLMGGAALAAGTLLALNGATAQGASVMIQVDVSANRHPIDPNIYGVSYASPAQLARLNAPLNRSGGNATSRYNWQLNATNRARDFYYESLPADSEVPGELGDTFITDSRSGGAQPMLTVPMLGWVAKLGPNRSPLSSFSIAKYGAQTDADWEYFPDAGDGVSAATGEAITGNDPNDANQPADVAFQQGWVSHLLQRWGSAANGGLRYYFLDNEPSIWYETHRDVHPTGATMEEIRDRMIAYGGMVKTADPTAQTLGPEEWGWLGYLFSGYDQQWGVDQGREEYPDRDAHGGMDFLPWLLGQLRQHEQTSGRRVLDVFSVHYYPQGGEHGDDTSPSMQLLRNRSTRSLWDPDYVDETYIGDTVQLVPRLRGWVNSYYPGTKIGITEYNWGAEGHINGATTQADILGIFGREGLDLANRWTTPAASTPTFKAMKLFRNYDGNKNGFGDVSVAATVPNPDNVSAFAAQRTADGAVTVVAINKQLGVSQPVTVSVAGFSGAGRAEPWQLTSANAISRLTDVTVTNGSFAVTVPAQSITLFVLPAENSTTPPEFNSSASASPSPVAPGATSTLSATVDCTAGSLTDGIVDLEVYDGAGTRVGQQSWTGEPLTAGQSKSYSFDWTAPSAVGTYQLKVGVFGPDWSPNYYWNDAAGTVTVAAPAGTGKGLRGEYFASVSLSGSAKLTRTDKTVNFGWGKKSPGKPVPKDGFSVRWTGQVQAPVAGSYVFSTVSDDGVRLWVNGQLLIDDWTDHTATENTAPAITLAAGQKVDVRMEYYDRSSTAVARLLWAYPGQGKQVVPKLRLYVP